MLLYQFIITAVLLFFLSCSSDKNKDYSEKIQQLQQSQQPTPEVVIETPEVKEQLRDCSMDFFDSAKEIKQQSQGPFFQYQVYSERQQKNITMQAHDFAQLNQTLNACRAHVKNFQPTPFKCIDINETLHEVKEVFDYCRSLELRNTHDENFRIQRKYFRSGDADFLNHLDMKNQMLKEYNNKGKLISEIKKVEIKVLSNKVEEAVGQGAIVNGKLLDKEFESLLRFQLGESSEKFSDAILVGCQLTATKTSPWQFINLYDSFESSSLLVTENEGMLINVYDETATTVKIYPSKNFKGDYDRAFSIECRSQIPRLLTIENINKTLQGFVELREIQ